MPGEPFGSPGIVYSSGGAIHSAGTIVSDFALKIAPFKAAQIIDMTEFIRLHQAPGSRI